MSNRQYIHLQPSNQPVDRKIGYSKGTPLINFTLGESGTTALLGSTVRINGKINFLDSSGAKLATDKALTNARLGARGPTLRGCAHAQPSAPHPLPLAGASW